MLPGHIQKLFLGAVAQFALPVAHAVFGHHGAHAHRRGILLFNFGRGIPGSDVIVHLHAAFGCPFGFIGAECDGAHRRIIPQKAVAAAGHIERYTGLAVAVGQFQRGTFFVQMQMLILAHAENLFVVIGFEPCHHGIIIASGHRAHFTGTHTQRNTIPVQPVAVAPVFLGQQFTLVVVEGNPPFLIHPGFDLAVFQAPSGGSLVILFPFFPFVPGIGIIHGFAGNFCRIFRKLLIERPVVFVHFRLCRYPHTQTVFTPGFDPCLHGATGQNQSVSFLINCHQ